MGLRRVPPEIKAEAHFPGRGFDTRQFHQFSSFKQQKDKNMTTSTFNSFFNTSNTIFNNKENNMNVSRYTDNSLDEMNSAPRCPVVLLLDTSSSMDGAPIDELNQGLKQFIEETANVEAASMSVELEIITFDSTANVAMPFTPICDVDRNPAPLVADGMTCMGAAIRMASSDLRNRRMMYRNAGISSYKPWVSEPCKGERNPRTMSEL